MLITDAHADLSAWMNKPRMLFSSSGFQRREVNATSVMTGALAAPSHGSRLTVSHVGQGGANNMFDLIKAKN